MAAEPLPQIPAHSFVFIDANIFVYGLSGQSIQCRDLLDRCLREELTGITLFETVNEVTHRFMVAEALSKGLITSGRAKDLRAKPGLISQLHDYWRNTERLLALNLHLPSGERGHPARRTTRTPSRKPANKRLPDRLLDARARPHFPGDKRRRFRTCRGNHSL